jgi:hypothetical protein
MIGSRHQIGPVRVINRPDIPALWGYTLAGNHRLFISPSVLREILIEHLEQAIATHTSCGCTWPLPPHESY